MTSNDSPRSATVCAHAGEPRAIDTASLPIHLSSVAEFDSIEASLGPLSGRGFAYRRNGSPNADELAAAVAALEGAADGLATASGMGAIAAAVLSLVQAGDRVVVQRDGYGGTRALFDADLTRLGVRVEHVDARDLDAVEAAARDSSAILVEAVSNPLLEVLDIEGVAERGRRAGAVTIVDNTFATPLRQRPLEAGADSAVHSATKFLGGHHDLCAGVVVGAPQLVDRARQMAGRLGLGCPPLDAWLAVRGLRTLFVRMERAWQTAGELAGRLHAHPAVRRVRCPERCALVAIELAGRAAVEKLVAGLRTIPLSPSLGGVVTTLSHPASSSHRALAPSERDSLGIHEGVLRMSVGLEDVEDLWTDLESAL